MVDQRFVFDEVLRILLDVLVPVAKAFFEGRSDFKDLYQIINVGKGGRPDGYFCRRRVGSVRHVCLGGLAVIMVEEDMPAWAYGRLSYMLESPGMSMTPIVRPDSANLLAARRRKISHIIYALHMHLSYQTGRQDAIDKAANRKMAEEGW